MIARMSEMGTLTKRPSGSLTASVDTKKEKEIERKSAQRSHSKTETELGLEPVFLRPSFQFIPLPQYRHSCPRSVLLHVET